MGTAGDEQERVQHHAGEELMMQAPIWDRIVEKHGLRRLSLEETVKPALPFFDNLAMCSNTRAVEQSEGVDWTNTAPVGHLSSTIAIRKAGFTKYVDTEEMLESWLRRLQREKYI